MKFKIMTFNLLFGGGEEARFQGILDVIRQARPDVLVMQECLGWENGERLKQVAAAMDIPAEPSFIYLGMARPRGSGRRFHVAIASRWPLHHVQTHNSAAFLGHCMVQVELTFDQEKLTLFGTHFDAHHENLRFVEARYLRSLIEPERFMTGFYLLAGDLNALSPKDPYPTNLEALLRQSGTEKYQLPPRFEVIQELESFGWIDTLYYRNAERPDWITARRNRGGVQIDYRTDYIFASPPLGELLQAVEVIDIAGVSDHQPVMATFQVTTSTVSHCE